MICDEMRGDMGTFEKTSQSSWLGRFARPWQAIRCQIHGWAWLDTSDSEKTRSVRFLLDICSGLLLLNIFILIRYLLAPSGHGLRIFMTLGATICLLACPVVLRSSRSLHAGILFVMLPCIAAAVVLANINGGLGAPTSIILVITPTFATLSFGSRIGLWTLFLCILCAVFLALTTVMNIRLQSNAQPSVLVHLVVMVLSTLFVFETVRRFQVREKEHHHALAQRDRLAALGTFAAGVGHEINNPLSVITLNASIIHSDVAAEDVPIMLEDIQMATSRIAAIVEDLRSYVRAEHHVEKSRVRLLVVLEEARIQAQSRIKHAADVRFDIPQDPWLISDHPRLTQVFTNLLVNAQQAVEQQSDGLVTVRATQDEKECRVVCSDNGPGFPQDERDRMLDPFYTTRGSAGGTGLGLFLVYTIVQSLRGTMSIGDAPGGGAEVIITLPLAEAPAALQHPPHAIDESPLQQLAPLRVLVVDDDELVGRTLTRALLGHEVVVASSGEEALTLLGTDVSPDIVLLDFTMPTMDGITFYRALEKDHEALLSRLIFLTAGAFSRDGQRFLASTLVPVLYKPVSVEDLLSSVTMCLQANEIDEEMGPST